MDFAASAAFIGSMQLISGICGALSALGSLVLIVSFVVYSSEQWRSADGSASVERKVKALIGGYLLQVCFLAVSDLLVGVSWVLSLFLSPDTSPDDTLCVVQAWLLALTPLISAAWTACLATELLMLAINIRKEVTGSFARRRYWFYHASWVLPLALGIPLIPGPSRPMFIGGMCWLDDGLAGEQPFVWLYIPKLAVMAYVVGVYLRVSGHVCAADAASATVDVADEDLSAQGSRRHPVSRCGWCAHRACLRVCCCYHCVFTSAGQRRSELSGRARNGCLACVRSSPCRLAGFHLYPAIYLACTVFPLLLRLNIGLRDNPKYPGHAQVVPGSLVGTFAGFLGPAQGILNCVVFIVGTTSVRRQVGALLRRTLGCVSCGASDACCAPPPPLAGLGVSAGRSHRSLGRAHATGARAHAGVPGHDAPAALGSPASLVLNAGADPRPLAPSPTAADGLLMDPGGGPAGGSPADPGRSGNGGGGMGSSVSSGGSGNGSRLGQWDSGDEEEEDDFALALLTARGMAPAAAAAAAAPARMRPVASQDELDARAMLRSYGLPASALRARSSRSLRQLLPGKSVQELAPRAARQPGSAAAGRQLEAGADATRGAGQGPGQRSSEFAGETLGATCASGVPILRAVSDDAPTSAAREAREAEARRVVSSLASRQPPRFPLPTQPETSGMLAAGVPAGGDETERGGDGATGQLALAQEQQLQQHPRTSADGPEAAARLPEQAGARAPLGPHTMAGPVPPRARRAPHPRALSTSVLRHPGFAAAMHTAQASPQRQEPATRDAAPSSAAVDFAEAVGDDYGEALDFSFVAQPSDGSSLGGSGADEPMVRRSSAGSDWEFG